MRSILLGIAALLCLWGASLGPANAVTYDISASYNSSLPSSIAGSFTMDTSVGPASISNVGIQVTLPLAGGPFSFTFDQVFNPVDTWSAGYLDFTNYGYGAGDTHFFTFLTSLNNGSYLIGIGFNSHQSEISVIGVNDWQGITGVMTPEAVAATPLPPTWTMMLIGLAGFGVFAFRGKYFAG